jgi:hypothetical protein
MCNLSSIPTNQSAISALFRVVNRYVGDLAPMPGVFPRLPGADRPYRGRRPRTRHGSVGHAVVSARADGGTKKRAAKLEAKGKPVDFKQLLRIEPDAARSTSGT